MFGDIISLKTGSYFDFETVHGRPPNMARASANDKSSSN
jgi:hypothetical protein